MWYQQRLRGRNFKLSWPWLCLVYRAVEAMTNCAEPGLDLPCSFTSCCSSHCLSALLPPVGQKSALYSCAAALCSSSPAWKVWGKQALRTWTSSQHSLSIFRRNQNGLPCCPLSLAALWKITLLGVGSGPLACTCLWGSGWTLCDQADKDVKHDMWTNLTTAVPRLSLLLTHKSSSFHYFLSILKKNKPPCLNTSMSWALLQGLPGMG